MNMKLTLAAMAIISGPVLADVPNPQNADHLTGCLQEGHLQDFEISGWGAYRACGPNAEWVTVERANIRSRVFTVEAQERLGAILSGPGYGGGLAFTPVVTVGAFTIYSASQACAIAVGPAAADAVIIFAGHPAEEISAPFLVGLAIGDDTPTSGAIRQGAAEEVFYSPYADGVFSAEVLHVRTVFAMQGHHSESCRAAVTFEYEETPSAHTIYRHDAATNGVAVEYRQDLSQ